MLLDALLHILLPGPQVRKVPHDALEGAPELLPRSSADPIDWGEGGSWIPLQAPSVASIYYELVRGRKQSQCHLFSAKLKPERTSMIPSNSKQNARDSTKRTLIRLVGNKHLNKTSANQQSAQTSLRDSFDWLGQTSCPPHCKLLQSYPFMSKESLHQLDSH